MELEIPAYIGLQRMLKSILASKPEKKIPLDIDPLAQTIPQVVHPQTNEVCYL